MGITSSSSGDDSPPDPDEQFKNIILNAKNSSDKSSNDAIASLVSDDNKISDYDKITALNESLYPIRDAVINSFKDLTGVDVITTCKKELDEVQGEINKLIESSKITANSQVNEINNSNIRLSNLTTELNVQSNNLNSLSTFVSDANNNYTNIINKITTNGTEQQNALKVIALEHYNTVLSEYQLRLANRQDAISKLKLKLNNTVIRLSAYSESYTRRISLLNEKYQSDIATIHISDYKNLYGIVENENIGFQRTKDAIINKYTIYDVETAAIRVSTSNIKTFNKVLYIMYAILVIYVIYFIATSNKVINIDGFTGLFIKGFVSGLFVAYPFVMPYFEIFVYNCMLFIQAWMYNTIYVGSNV